MFLKKKIHDETVAIAKMKRNPKVFYSLAKKKKKVFGGVSPFLKENGERMQETEAEVLTKTYEKAFSEPNTEAKVLSPEDFSLTQIVISRQI